MKLHWLLLSLTSTLLLSDPVTANLNPNQPSYLTSWNSNSSNLNLPEPIFSSTQAQVLAKRAINTELKKLLDEGEKLLKQGNYSEAISIYKQAEKIQPKNASIHSGIGFIYTKVGNYPAALKAFRRAVQLEPNNSYYQYALGYISGSLKDYRTAREAYRRAIQVNRRKVNAYIGLGTILLRQGDKNSAMWAYREAAKIDPENPLVSELKNNIQRMKTN
jgi:Flp pilus assembly protein TadD